jgi:hypothetical protein
MIGLRPLLTRPSSPQIAEILIEPGFFGPGAEDCCAFESDAGSTEAAATARPVFSTVLREFVCDKSM